MLRVGSARELAADGASLVELQQAGGWRSPTTPAVRRESATRGPVARRRYGVGALTGWDLYSLIETARRRSARPRQHRRRPPGLQEPAMLDRHHA